MQMAEMIVQAQVKLQDGGIITLTTPPLTPDPQLSPAALHDKLMALGENQLFNGRNLAKELSDELDAAYGKDQLKILTEE